MSAELHASALVDRVRRLAGVLASTDLLRLRIERDGSTVELGRQPTPAPVEMTLDEAMRSLDAAPTRVDLVKADLVGIFRLARPAPAEGDLLETDRDLAYVEALGIRNPVRSLGAGRIVAIRRHDGEAVEYGATLFEIDRG